MRQIYNNKGIALVTSLMFTVLSLVITMTLLYMIGAGIKTSGAMKRYKTVTEAAYAGADIMMKDLLSKGLSDALALNMDSTAIETSTQIAARNAAFRDSLLNTSTGYMKTLVSTGAAPDISDCLRAKLTNYFSEKNKKWTAACGDNSLKLGSSSYDFKLNLSPTSGSPYVVYTKIVDTMEHRMTVFENTSTSAGWAMRPKIISIAGNSEPSGLNLDGRSTSDPGEDKNPHVPYVYRIEVQAERQQNSNEKSKLSLQYIY